MAAGRPKVFVEEEAIEKAFKLFSKKGYGATSTDDILKAMDIGKGSMYHSFGSKKTVFKLSLEHYGKNSIKKFSESLQNSKDPIKTIKEFFRGIANECTADHKKGCFLGNTVAELAGLEPLLEKQAGEFLKDFEDSFYVAIKRAQKEKLLESKTDARLLARYLLNFWNGLNITRRIYQNSKELLPIIELQLSILK